MVGGLANQWFKYFGKYLSHFIGDGSFAGHYRPEGSFHLIDLGEPIEFGGDAFHGAHIFICVII